MSLIHDPLIRALERIEQHITHDKAEGAALSAALQSHRAGMQFAFFAIVSAMKLSPGFDVSMLRQFVQTALDHPPPEFAGNATFQEPLTLLMALTTDSPEKPSA